MFPESPFFFNKDIEFPDVLQRNVTAAALSSTHTQTYNWRFLWVKLICEASLLNNIGDNTESVSNTAICWWHDFIHSN